MKSFPSLPPLMFSTASLCASSNGKIADGRANLEQTGLFSTQQGAVDLAIRTVTVVPREYVLRRSTVLLRRSKAISECWSLQEALDRF